MKYRNFSCFQTTAAFIAKPSNKCLSAMGIPHIFALRSHSLTDGKIEQLNRTTKEKVLLIVYASPEELDRALEASQHGYNHEHYCQGIGNLHSADM